ncbi:hypothetical protein D7V80_37140 [Corallococcus sp. CA054B]|uniref:imm11 family protein n=1 Tax=Corallococcus sp. CA054B TaxID=2316734 RepID=UPI000EA0AC78|nr:DUF1629 domain-containing protein [Corallococcus sp. CA054B]RKG59239.1 hypothetical protein D7V80_37140 [Corallococcus sp. CA054B]
MFRRLTNALRRLWLRPSESSLSDRQQSLPGGTEPTVATPRRSRASVAEEASPPVRTSRPRRPAVRIVAHGAAPHVSNRKTSRRASATTPRFYDLHDDFRAPNRWEPGDPLDLEDKEVGDVWMFTAGRPVNPPGPLHIPNEQRAAPLDFSLAGAGLTPVVHPRVAAVFARLAPEDVQLIPVHIEGQPEPYFLVVATRLIRCVDEAACLEVLRYGPGDGVPARVGQYRSVRGLRIDPTQVGRARVFRPWGWPVTLVVSEVVKEALEKEGVTGARFTPITDTRH